MNTLHFSQFLYPIVRALREGGGSLTQGEMVDAVDRIMSLPEAVMERRHARYSIFREFDYCLALAQAYLKKVGYLTRSTRGVWVLTAEGKVIDVREASVDFDTEDVPGEEVRATVEEECVRRNRYLLLCWRYRRRFLHHVKERGRVEGRSVGNTYDQSYAFG